MGEYRRTGGQADRRTGGLVLRLAVFRAFVRSLGYIKPAAMRQCWSMQQPYERFEAWKSCHALALEVYRISASWPAGERFGLTAQARRAAFSSPANIVEGSARRGAREFRYFLNVAVGSLAE